jgi:integrase
MGRVKLTEVRPIDVEEFYSRLIDNKESVGNVKKVSEVLSSALEHAVSQGLIAGNPVRSATKPKPKPVEIKPFTPDEIKRIREASKGNRLEGMILLDIATGMREGELLGLQWDDIDFRKKKVSVRRTLAVDKDGFHLKEPKSERGRRTIEIPQFAVDALLLRKEQAEKEGYLNKLVFCTKTGEPTFKSNFIRKVHQVILENALVPYRKFHTYRHTHVSELLTKGIPIAEVARRVGDSQEVIYRTYSHYIRNSESHIVEAIDELYA